MQVMVRKLLRWAKQTNWKKVASASFLFFFAKGMMWVAAAAWVALSV